MDCPHCGSQAINKNGRRQSRQNYLCKDCGRQFLEFCAPRGYPDAVKQLCIRMHSNGLKYRELERLTGISHNTIILWVRQANQKNESND